MKQLISRFRPALLLPALLLAVVVTLVPARTYSKYVWQETTQLKLRINGSEKSASEGAENTLADPADPAPPAAEDTPAAGESVPVPEDTPPAE